jgi:FHA domain
VTTVRSVVHPGWLAVTGPGVHAVVEATEPEGEALAAAAAGGLLPLLDALTAHGLSAAPSFALVARDDDAVRVLVRGKGTVVLGDGTRLGSHGRMPWADVDVDDQAAGDLVVVQAPEPEVPRGWRLPARLTRRPPEAAQDVEPSPPDPVLPPTSAMDLPPEDEPGPGDDRPEPPVDPSADGADAGSPDASHVDGDGPMVPAVRCPAGHACPPGSEECRTCGLEVPPQDPVLAPRPPLGALKASTGEVVPLDRSVLLGRAPRVDEETPPEQRPRLLRVGGADRDISRTHAEVVLDGWQVLVRDLGSTNGTTVTPPGGRDPVPVLPHEDVGIEPGTVITLADEVSLTYELDA